MEVTGTILLEILVPGVITLLGLLAVSGSVIDLTANYTFFNFLRANKNLDATPALLLSVIGLTISYLIGAVSNNLVWYLLPYLRRRREELNLKTGAQNAEHLNTLDPGIIGPMLITTGPNENRRQRLDSITSALYRMWTFVASRSEAASREMQYYRYLGRVARGSLPGLIMFLIADVIYAVSFYRNGGFEAIWLTTCAVVFLLILLIIRSADLLEERAVETEVGTLVNAFFALISMEHAEKLRGARRQAGEEERGNATRTSEGR